jgi:hypothetical protein
MYPSTPTYCIGGLKIVELLFIGLSSKTTDNNDIFPSPMRIGKDMCEAACSENTVHAAKKKQTK